MFSVVLFCSAVTMDTYVSLLQTYSGRDKILRTVSYVASLLSGSVKKEETATKLVTVARQISNSRVVLRFFDDILMWRITKHLSVEVCCNGSQFCCFIIRNQHSCCSQPCHIQETTQNALF